MWRTQKKTPSPPSFLSLFLLLTTLSTLPTPSKSATDTFVFGGCSQLKYSPGSPYETNVNSVLTSFVNSAMYSTYNNFTFPSSGGATSTLYGLFQCRGDLGNDACARCVAHAVSQLGTLCQNSCGGALQLEGCFVKYDNTSFLGAEDKTVVVKKCGPPVGYDSDALNRRDAVLDYLGSNSGAVAGAGGLYRVGGSGNLQGVAQCVGDLSPAECQDCLSDAIQRLRTDCGPASWGDVYLAKCYARFSEGGAHSAGNDDNNNDNEIEKTLAILIGLIAGVALLIVFLSFLRKLCESGKGGK
ncbi:Gnk2-like domain containing protein [Trema orientale]|uniref:Gnk2-like domain containing protein n=1 Tax=Trema orientale TaxID=63057 RepID=A0A2P5BG41_TREOI|nr:Gnk2-like domain containing protein [Trema orientale]